MVYRADVITTLLWDVGTLPKKKKFANLNDPTHLVAGPDHEQRSSPPRKDGEPRNHHDSPPISMGRTPCSSARHPPTQTNPLLGARIWHETTWSSTSSIQGSTQKYLADDRNRSGLETEVAERTNWSRTIHNKTAEYSKTSDPRRDEGILQKSSALHLLSPHILCGGSGHLYRSSIIFFAQKEMSKSTPILGNEFGQWRR